MEKITAKEVKSVVDSYIAQVRSEELDEHKQELVNVLESIGQTFINKIALMDSLRSDIPMDSKMMLTALIDLLETVDDEEK